MTATDGGRQAQSNSHSSFFSSIFFPSLFFITTQLHSTLNYFSIAHSLLLSCCLASCNTSRSLVEEPMKHVRVTRALEQAKQLLDNWLIINHEYDEEI